MTVLFVLGHFVDILESTALEQASTRNNVVCYKSYRWQHKGDDGLVLSKEWKIMIHVALQNALSVNRKHDKASNGNKDRSLRVGDEVEVTVVRIVPNFAIVTIDDGKYRGSIHISQLSEQFNEKVEEEVAVGDVRKAKVMGFDETHNKWKLTLRKI